MFQVAFVCDRGYLKQQSLVETKTDVVSCYAAEAQLLRLFAALFEAYHRSSEMKWFTQPERLFSLDGLFFSAVILLCTAWVVMGVQWPLFHAETIITQSDIRILDVRSYKGRQTIHFDYQGRHYASPCYSRQYSELSVICYADRDAMRNRALVKDAVLVSPELGSNYVLLAQGRFVLNGSDTPFVISPERREEFIYIEHNVLFLMMVVCWLNLLYLICCLAYLYWERKLNTDYRQNSREQHQAT